MTDQVPPNAGSPVSRSAQSPDSNGGSSASQVPDFNQSPDFHQTPELHQTPTAHWAPTYSDPPTITIPVVLPLNQHARVWMMLSGVLGIMLIAALVIVGYLWNVNGKWQDQVTSLTTTGYDLGDRLADHKKQIDQLESTNGLLTDQLATAKDKVLSLSDEKAQWSDQTAFAQQQVDLLTQQVIEAQDVLIKLGRCVEGEQQLVEYLGTVDVYSPAQVEQYRNSVAGLCASASAAQADFQRSLTE